MRFSVCIIGVQLGILPWAEAQIPAVPPVAATSRLPKIVVTPTGMEADAFDVPFVVEYLDAADLQNRRLARTLIDSLKELPAVMLQKTAHGQGSPFVRGFTGFRTLMLVDGIRLNNSTFRDGPNQYWNTIDSFSIRRLELVKGPASVLYGSDAIGGTVNALTLQRESFSQPSAVNGRVYYRYSSAEHSQLARGELSANAGPHLGASAGFSEKRFGDLRTGGSNGVQPHTGYGERARDVKLEYVLSPKARVVAAYQTLNQNDAWRTHRTLFGQSWRGTSVGTDRKLALDQFRDLAYVQYHHTALGGAVDAVHVSVSHQRQEEREERVRSANQQSLQGFDVGTTGISAQLESPGPFGRWVYGAEYYKDNVDSFRRNYRANGTLESLGIQGPVADDARYDLLGAYLQDNVSLGERHELILGARHTRAEAAAGRVQDPISGAPVSLRESWTSTVGSARLLWRMDRAERWHFFGGASQGFRAPNLSDLTRFDIARSGELELPSTGLRPERFTSYEFGVKANHQRVSGQAAYFYTRIDNMIDRVPADDRATPGVIEVRKANVGQGFVHGIELSGQIELGHGWSTWATVTSMKGEVDTFISTTPPLVGRRPLSRIMPFTANTGMRWEHRSKKIWSEVSATFADRQDRLSPGDETDTQRIPPGGTPGYSVVHARMGWRLAKSFAVSVALENVANREYRIHGSGLNETGRNFVIAGDLRL